MLRKFFPILLLTLGTLLQASPAPLRALDPSIGSGQALESAGLIQVPIPAGSVTVAPVSQADLNGDGAPESLALTGGILSILSGGGTAWQSPGAWQVIQAAITDLDRDSKPEVTLLLWRPFQPWRVDEWLPNGGRIAAFHDAEGQSCHIILIGWTRGGYHELWAGSAMSDPITAFAAADVNGDHIQELVALEGRYADNRSAPARTLKIWEWNGFGFTVVSFIDGIFNQMALVQTDDGHILILVP